MPLRLDARAPDFADAFRRFLEAPRGAEAEVDAVVAGIIADVRNRGDAAVIAYTERFDRVRLTADRLRVGVAEVEAAIACCAPEAMTALDRAAERIETYHRHQLPRDWRFGDEDGLELGQRWRPLATVGIYVPGGRAAYPSSVLMNALPARIAGVGRIAMAVPTQGGALNPLVLAAARRAGVDEIYRIGGAQAVAALAWGTTTIPRVDKIVGPGNAYVTAAKRQVFGQVGIDTIAGPSEILVVADRDNDPAWIAADLLSQAEHDESAQSILIADDDGFIDAVLVAIERQLARLPRAAIARASWDNHGAVIRVAALDEAAVLIDAVAPEHLELAMGEPESLADRVNHAGAIFLGRHAPEAIGDYVAGPSHVLPTARAARFASGLGVLDFMKRTSLVRCDAIGLAQVGPAAIALARAEGLEAHAHSVAIRLDRRS